MRADEPPQESFSIDLSWRLARWLSRGPIEPKSFNDVEDTVSLGTWIGRRETNQDVVVSCSFASALPGSNFSALVLCDGVGGLRDGDAVARLAVATIISRLSTFRAPEGAIKLRSAINAANQEIWHRYKGDGGCTLSAVLFSDGATVVGNVGDSRVYAMYEAGLRQVSTDDTLAAHVKLGDPLAQSLPEFSSLVQYIGIGPALDANIIPLSETPTSIFLTSDGLHFVGNKVLESIELHADTGSKFAQRALDLAEWMGGSDNASVAFTRTKARARSTGDFGGKAVLRVWDSRGSLELWYTQREFQPLSALNVDDPSSNHYSEKKLRRGRQPRKPPKHQENEASKSSKPGVQITFNDVSESDAEGMAAGKVDRNRSHNLSGDDPLGLVDVDPSNFVDPLSPDI